MFRARRAWIFEQRGNLYDMRLIKLEKKAQEIVNIKEGKKVKVGKKNAVETRDFVMFMLSISNGLRSSNLLP